MQNAKVLGGSVTRTVIGRRFGMKTFDRKTFDARIDANV